MNVKFICKQCGKEFEKQKNMVKYLEKQGKIPVFCSRKCSDENRKDSIIYHKFSCLYCNKKFVKTDREVKNAKSKNYDIKFCSKECKSNYWGRNRVEVTCPVCGKKYFQQYNLKDKNYTCSEECAKLKKDSYYKKYVCECCGKEYMVEKSYIDTQKNRNQNIRFCSKECFNKSISKNLVEVNCSNCNKKFKKNKSNIGLHNFCSINCKKEYHENNDRKDIVCKQCGKVFSTNKYQADHGRKFCSIDCRNKNREIDKDSYAQISHYIRTSKEYNNWRISVLEKSDYKCSECGSVGILQAHHIYPLYKICNDFNYSINKIMKSDIFNDLKNGLCLCVDCHKHKHPQLQRNKKGQYCRPEISLQKSLDD